MIYAFAAYNLDNHRVLVLVDWFSDLYPSPAAQAYAENHDKRHLLELPYCPIWAKDAHEVGNRWLELKAHVPFEIALPFVRAESVVVPIRVKRILQDHDPFRAYAYHWGQVDRYTVKGHIKSSLYEPIPREVTRGCSSYHSGRIAWMVQNPSLCGDPIDVYLSTTRRMFVENGNHRLAAAIIRGDQNISTRLYGHGIYGEGEMVGL